MTSVYVYKKPDIALVSHKAIQVTRIGRKSCIYRLGRQAVILSVFITRLCNVFQKALAVGLSLETNVTPRQKRDLFKSCEDRYGKWVYLQLFYLLLIQTGSPYDMAFLQLSGSLQRVSCKFYQSLTRLVNNQPSYQQYSQLLTSLFSNEQLASQLTSLVSS